MPTPEGAITSTQTWKLEAEAEAAIESEKLDAAIAEADAEEAKKQ
jgi:hypothetical protein